MNYNINGIIKFQRLYKFMKQEFNSYNLKRDEISNILYSMYENLEIINNLKIFENCKKKYNFIFSDIELLIKKCNELPQSMSFKSLKVLNYTMDDLNVKLYELEYDIKLYMNHITTSNLRLTLTTFYGKDFYFKFNFDDYYLMSLLSQIFNPISIWDSEFHFNIVNHKKAINERKVIKKDSIDKLMNIDENSTSLIISDKSLPLFLNKLSEYIVKDGSSNSNRTSAFDLIHLNEIFSKEDSQIIITENYLNKTFVENYRGIIVHIKMNNKYICIQGILKNDILDIYKNNKLILKNISIIRKHINYNILTVPKKFKNTFLKNLSLKDLLIVNTENISNNLKNKYNEYKKIKNKNLKVLINDFLLSSKHRKIDILLTLLYSQEDNKLAYLLYDVMKIKDKKNITEEILSVLPIRIRNNLDSGKKELNELESELLSIDINDIPYERRICLLNVSKNIKDKATSKLKSIKNNMQGDSKAQDWLDGLLKIPFGVYKTNKIIDFKKDFIQNINEKYSKKLFSLNDIEKFSDNLDSYEKDKWDNYKNDKKLYLENVRNTLNTAVYGHDNAKKQLERVFAQWINGDNKGEILGLWGPPGTGKTSLAKNGLAKCLIDDNNIKRPFAFLPIGGSVNGSTLVGHNYTYVGSTWGRIVDILITTECMNPIIFIDELDKISNTENGREISSILTHLTDFTQNDTFEDKYFSGIPFDLSKALIVFSFNDIDKIDPILKDRITVIETKAFTIEDKINIINDYMLPEILKETGYNCNEIVFSEEIIKYIIKTYTHEAGVRKIKEKLMEIIREINLNKVMDNLDNSENIFYVTKEYIQELFKTKPKIRIKKICSTPQIGLVNGLYATTSGIGGLTIIQIMKFPSDKMMELNITGQQGDVMKESVKYALRIAYSLLTDEEQNKILQDNKDKKSFGLHIHTPDAATKKDGPSAGAAMTLAIYSILSGRKINNEVALTGEIDLMKNVTAIGGEYAKLNGAKEAGVKKALIPKENLDDLNILRDKGISPEDENFKVETIETIEDVMYHCLV